MRQPGERRSETAKPAAAWDAAAVRTWLESRIASARADQVAAERGGRERQDECDMAAAEEMVCTLLKGKAAEEAGSFVDALKALLDRDDYLWRGVYDDRRFDRHVRAFIRKLVKMAKTNDGFGNLLRYQ